jgi:lysophospholipid acyltransferase (LPLAT)-like uncharacterized protein
MKTFFLISAALSCYPERMGPRQRRKRTQANPQHRDTAAMTTPSPLRSIRTRLLVTAASAALRLWFGTCRVRIKGGRWYDRYIAGPDKVVGATWHRGAIFLVWFFRRQRPMIMFSRSRDGDLFAAFAARLGVVPVRGSSSRGGREALVQMAHFLKRPGPQKAATVLDGPRGPRYLAKKGMILLAMEAGVPLLPIMVSARPAFTLEKAWDKTMIPLPFSRVTVSFREPWQIPADLSEAKLEALRQEVERTLNHMMAELDRETGYRSR